MNKFFIFLICFIFSGLAVADDCVVYKLKPNINLSSPDWVKTVVQPLQPMNLFHGNVVATMVDNYDITADITPIEDGFCIGIKNIDATIGYSDFEVRVDIRHQKNTCSYDAVLSHEDQHINAYLSVIDDFKQELENSVFSAANSIMPIYIKDYKDAENAINKLNEQLQNHPDLILIKQKIKAAEEIRNKQVDENSNNETLKKCIEQNP